MLSGEKQLVMSGRVQTRQEHEPSLVLSLVVASSFVFWFVLSCFCLFVCFKSVLSWHPLHYLSMELAWQSDYTSKLVISAICTNMLGT